MILLLRMEGLKNTLTLIVGQHGEVTMTSSRCIIITHSQGKHTFRIYEDVTGTGMVYFHDSQGGFGGSPTPKWDVVDFLSKLFDYSPSKSITTTGF